jgi:hypothetical protein
LDKVPRELEIISSLLVSQEFRLIPALQTESAVLLTPKLGASRSRFLAALKAWVNSDERKRNDHLVLYWTGHGVVEAEELYFVLPDTEDVTIDGIRAQEISEILFNGESRLGPCLMLLDVCYAGQVALDLAARLPVLVRQRPRGRPPEISVVCAAGPRSEAEQMIFATAFAGAVRCAEDPDKRLEPSLFLDEILERMSAELRRTGQAIFSFFYRSADAVFLRNRFHIPHLPRGIDVATARVLGRLDTAGRGVAAPEIPGWFFKGRKRVFADLCSWLNGQAAPSLCVVTGKVGAGKSAVLGRLYSLSRKDLREVTPPEVIAQTDIPHLGTIDAAMYVGKMSLSEVTYEVSARLGIATVDQDQLIRAIQKRDKVPTLLFDGLDETLAPKRTRQFLEKLASTCRVLVGTRRLQEDWVLAPALCIDLDRNPWADPAAIGEYVLDRLESGMARGETRKLSWLEDLTAVATAVTTRAEDNFLLANLIVTALITGAAGDPRSPNWEFPVTVESALSRLLESLNDEQPDAIALLTPLAFAEGGGLPKDQVWPRIAEELSERTAGSVSVTTIFEKAPWFFVEETESERSVYRTFHVALTELLKKGRDEIAVHRVFSRRLEVCVNDSSLGGVQDRTYALNYLSRHMRRGKLWRDLGKLITDSRWIERQFAETVFHSVRYDADVMEARIAAQAENRSAIADRNAVRALGVEIWWLLWRSGLVELAQKWPPQAWAFYCESQKMPVSIAIGVIAAIGDSQKRAAIVCALARVLTGTDLDALLDFAEGLRPELEANEASSSPHSQNPTALAQYNDILREALFGPDAFRLTQRALRSVRQMDGYSRWRVLEAALPHLNDAELEDARDLIWSISARNDRPWRSSAIAAYVAELAKRGHTDRAVADMPDDKDRQIYWLAVAALLSVGNSAIAAIFVDITVPRALELAIESISDSLNRLEIMTALVRELPNLSDRFNRKGLSLYLRAVHGSFYPDAQLRFATSAGAMLPDPHGIRLLRWTAAKMKASRRDLNINWYHTPPPLALALAERGNVEMAIQTVLLTEEHPYFRPKALADVGRACGRRSEEALASAVLELEKRSSKFVEGDIIQLLCNQTGATAIEQRARIERILSGYRLQFSETTREFRDMMQAMTADYSDIGQIETVRHDFFQRIRDLPPASKKYAVGRFSNGCAAKGRTDIVAESIQGIVDSFWRGQVWADVLSSAATEYLLSLVGEVVSNEHTFYEVIGDSEGLDVLLSISLLSSIDQLELIATRVPSRHSYYPSYLDCKLAAALEVRGYEIGAQHISTKMQASAGRGREILEEVVRRPLARQRGLIDAIARAQEFSAPDCAAFARVLAASEDRQEETSIAFVELIHDQNLIARWSQAWVAGSITPTARIRLISASVELVTMSGEYRPDDISWMLPWLEAPQIRRLSESARRFHDDFRQNELIVFLIERYAEVLGWQEATAFRDTVRRVDFQALSWAALWPSMPEAERSRIFAKLTPEKSFRSDRHAEALGEIAGHLNDAQLRIGAQWIIRTHSGNCAVVLRPLVSVACQRGADEGYEFLEAAFAEAALRPVSDIVECLVELIPLSLCLGGVEALDSMNTYMSRAVEMWP